MISVTFHEGGVVALCDVELLGKQFEDVVHYLSISERFYKGEIMNSKEVISILQDARSINLVGEDIVYIALEEGFVSESDILFVAGVPHVQIYAV